MVSWRDVIKLFTFGVVGLASALVYVGTVWLLIDLADLGHTLANLIGFSCAALTSYVGHHSFTFRADGNHHVYAPRFVAQVIITYLMSAGITEGASMLGVHHLVAAVTIAVLLPVMNFLAFQFWVFVAPRLGEEQETTGR